MLIRSRLRATAAVVAVLGLSAPIVAAAPASAAIGPLNALPVPGPDACLSGVVDPGPFGPSGPYGVDGPYGPNGPLHGSPNPLGNVPSCGGALAFLLRGGTVSSFVNANLASVGR
jgi:hypothetical protein